MLRRLHAARIDEAIGFYQHRPEDDARPAGSIGALSSEASVVDRQPSGAIEQFAIEQLMTAESKEGLQQLFVQHAHNNRPKQGCKGRPQ